MPKNSILKPKFGWFKCQNSLSFKKNFFGILYAKNAKNGVLNAKHGVLNAKNGVLNAKNYFSK